MLDTMNYKNLLDKFNKLNDNEKSNFNNNTDIFDEILDSEDFFYYLMREFKNTVDYATLDELAIFAFGSLQEALENYLEEKTDS